MSFTVQLPLAKSKSNTFVTIDEVKEFIKQNVKNVLLTAPGERIMLSDFGVGLRDFLFENALEGQLPPQLQQRIDSQFEEYLPDVTLLNVETEIRDNFLLVRVFYVYDPYNLQDNIEIKIQN
jgi:phage baseplate assembly protein W